MIKPHGSQDVIATGDVLFGVSPSVGVGKVYVRPNGTATITFSNSVSGATRPQAMGTGSAVISIPSSVTREFDLTGENMDTATVTLLTATSVLVEWEIG